MAKTNTGHAFAVRMAKARAAAAAKRGHHAPTKRARVKHRAAPVHHVAKAHVPCEHATAHRIFEGKPYKWCGRCGAIYLRARWRSPSRR